MNGGAIFDNESAAGNSGAVRVALGARFYMHPGAVIRNNSGTAGNNAAVQVTGAGSIFTMLGGEIQSNAVTAANSAGGVNVVDNGAFRMVGGVIYGTGSANANTSNPDHANSFPVLRLDATGTARRGTLAGNWDTAADLVGGSGIRGTGETIRVVNGVLQ